MGATEQLVTEHRTIERMLAVLEAVAQRLEGGQRVRSDLLREALDFTQNFTDRCHHGKEEANLFARLEARGIPRDGGPIGLMLSEHDGGRKLVQGIAENIDAYDGGDEGAARAIAGNARGYVALLREHIQKEEEFLFPAAEQILDQGVLDGMVKGFEQTEKEVMGPGDRERYDALLDALQKEMGLG